MSEYELGLLRQRGLAARDGKAGRGALRFTLPPGFVWSEDDRIELDPDERVQDAIRLVFAEFRELGSARQVFLWLRDAALQLPVVRRNSAVRRIEWRKPAYHSVVQVLPTRSTPAPPTQTPGPSAGEVSGPIVSHRVV